MSCELCNLEHLTLWYFEEDDFIVCDCKTCKVPVYIWREHSFPSELEVKMMKQHAKEHFPDYTIDMKRRKIPNHFHFHCRKNKG
jgi:hypothetical protein